MVPSANKLTLLDLSGLPQAEKYFIALSGGMDSMTLLHLLVTVPGIKEKLHAIHVDHQINSDSKLWADRCQHSCDQYGVPLQVSTVELPDHSENSARKARQQVFKNTLTDRDCLFTAHHQNDQIETILFRFLRGTGLNGLTGMDKRNNMAHYQVFRPLLHVSKSEIKAYAELHALRHVNDPSNLDNQYSRNHLRNEVIPVLQGYQRDVVNNIELTASNLSRSLNLINHLMGDANPIDLSSFNSQSLLSTALYHWMSAKNLSVPNHKRLDQFAKDCLSAEADKIPQLQFDQYQLLRWQNKIYALKVIDTVAESDIEATMVSGVKHALPITHGALLIDAAEPFEITVCIKFNQTHEQILLSKHRQHKKVKNLFQEMNIPPWQRRMMPYLYINDELMAVGSAIIGKQFQQLLTSHKAEYHWLSDQILL